MTLLTLVYPDGREWIAGGFPTADDASSWAASQNLDPSVTIRLTDVTPQTLTPS